LFAKKHTKFLESAIKMQSLKLQFWFLLPTIALTVCHHPQVAQASGFALSEQSVKGLGNAFTGGAAAVDDASTIFFNPAGLTELEASSVQAGAYYIAPTVRFNNQGSSLFNGTPLSGSEGGDAGVNAVVPNLYANWSISDRIKLGVGVNVPFALTTEYESDWVGRYQAVKSQLTTININPAIAAKLTEQLSVGAGVNLQYANAELSNAIDFGLIGLSTGLPTQPQSADGFVKVEGNDWSLGYNLGILYKPDNNTRIGLAYRSAITHQLRGEADFTVPTATAALTQRGAFTDTDAKAELKLPDTLSLSIYQKVSPKFALMGDVTWTNWSRFDTLQIDFDNPAQPSTVQPQNWRDTIRVGLGFNYQVLEQLTLRAGIAYDPTPVKDEYRTARIPDSDRTWLAVGASYKPSDSLSIDIGYAHLFVDDGSIEQVSRTEGTLRGKYENQVDIVGVQVNWSF
jgi:long-chain fatty acid transport protein